MTDHLCSKTTFVTILFLPNPRKQAPCRKLPVFLKSHLPLLSSSSSSSLRDGRGREGGGLFVCFANHIIMGHLFNNMHMYQHRIYVKMCRVSVQDADGRMVHVHCHCYFNDPPITVYPSPILSH